MNIQALILAGITLSIFLTVLSIGMRVAPGNLQCVLSNPPRLARALLAMNILGPIITIHHLQDVLVASRRNRRARDALHRANQCDVLESDAAARRAKQSCLRARALLREHRVIGDLTPLAAEVIQRLFGEGEVVHVSPRITRLLEVCARQSDSDRIDRDLA